MDYATLQLPPTHEAFVAGVAFVELVLHKQLVARTGQLIIPTGIFLLVTGAGQLEELCIRVMIMVRGESSLWLGEA